MRNIQGSSPELKDMAYKSLVRPILEYASASWDSHDQCLIDLVEKVQRRAATKVLRKFGRRHSPTEMMEELRWDTMQKRRKSARLTDMFHTLSGKEAFKDLLTYVKRSSFKGRDKNQYKLSIRGYNTNVGRYSFMGKTIPEWNNTTENIQKMPGTVEEFKLLLQ
jgi:hypothetical protein